MFIFGCDKTAQIHFSPDGQQAIYRSGGDAPRAYLLSGDGSVQREIGPSPGGYAWAKDSRTVYVGVKAVAAPTAVELGWTGQPNAGAAGEPIDGTTIVQLDGEQRAAVAHLAGKVVFMHLSSDGQWLAIQSAPRANDDALTLYALNLGSGHLYLVHAAAGFGMCFTGADRLLYTASGDGAGGALVELTLRDQAQAPPRQTVLNVLWRQTGWITGDANELLLTTRQATYPSPKESDYQTLYHYSRKDGGLVALAERVGGLFAPSPDGSRILFEQIGDQRALAVMNANGSGVKVLRKLSEGEPAMYPAWLGNDRIVWVDQHKQVVRYRLDEAGQLQPEAVLSGAWPAEMLPEKTEGTTRP